MEKQPLINEEAAPPHDHERSQDARTRRSLNIRLAMIGAFTLWLILYIYRGIAFDTATAPHRSSPSSTVDRILHETPLIDGHVDLLILIRAIYGNHIYVENFTQPFEQGGMLGHFDLPRAETSQMGGAFWSAFVPCPADGFDFSDEAYAPFVKATLEQIDLFNRLARKYPKYFTLSRSAAEAERNFYEHGRFVSPL
ncbi:hypothetical protein KC318_g13695, partial [Hortaea werneckii]